MDNLEENFKKVIGQVSRYFAADVWHDWQIVKSDLEYFSSKPFKNKSEDCKKILFSMLQKNNNYKSDKQLITMNYKSSLDIYIQILNLSNDDSYKNIPYEDSLFKSEKLIDIFKNSILKKINPNSFNIDFENNEMHVFEVLWACFVFYSEIIKRVWDNINYEAVSRVDTVFARYCFYAGQLCKEWDKHRSREKERTDKSTKKLQFRKDLTRKLLFEFLREKECRFRPDFGAYTIYNLIKDDWKKFIVQLNDDGKNMGAIPKSKSGLVPYVQQYLDLKKPMT